MSLWAMHTIADTGEGFDEMENRFIEKLLTRGPGLVIDSELVWEQLKQTLEQVLEKVAEGGMQQVACCEDQDV